MKKPEVILDKYRADIFRLYNEKNLRHTGGYLSELVNDYSHQFLEDSFTGDSSGSVLELGSSYDFHSKYVKDFSKYTLSDLNTTIIENDGFHGKTFINVDASKLSSYNLPKYDRIIACNLLEHLVNPELVLIDWMKCLEDGGTLSLLQPCDPGLLWRLGRNFGPRKNIKSLGMDYDLIMSLEHINPINNILTIVESLFASYKIDFFPFKIRSWNLNLFVSIHITKS